MIFFRKIRINKCNEKYTFHKAACGRVANETSDADGNCCIVNGDAIFVNGNHLIHKWFEKFTRRRRFV